MPNWKLYCIIDKGVLRGASPQKTAERLFKSGVAVVQLRYKNCPSYKFLRIAKEIQRLARKYGKTLLINDRIDVALASGAKGVHLGSGDLPLRGAYRLLDTKKIIGKTVHSTGEAKKLKCEKIDYVSAGPIFSTPLKKNLKGRGIDFVRKIKKYADFPVIAIGGINKRNAKAVLQTGVEGICVTRAAKEARDILKEIKK